VDIKGGVYAYCRGNPGVVIFAKCVGNRGLIDNGCYRLPNGGCDNDRLELLDDDEELPDGELLEESPPFRLVPPLKLSLKLTCFLDGGGFPPVAKYESYNCFRVSGA
jgi:hypothetical protein